MRKRGGGAKGEFIVCGNRVVALSRKPRTDYLRAPPNPHMFILQFAVKNAIASLINKENEERRWKIYTEK